VTATTVIAVYAAVLATAELGWQVFMWWRTTRTRLRVYTTGDISGSAVTAVRVRVVNESPFEVRIHHVFLVSRGETEHLWLAEEGEQGLPLTLPARDRSELSFSMSEGDLSADEPVIARVWTATGQEFLSTMAPLNKLTYRW